MTTSSLALVRRQRRRRRLAIFLSIAVVLGAIALGVSYRSERRQTAEYLALADEVARGEAAIAESLQGMFAGLRDLDRSNILELVERMRVDSEELHIRIVTADVTRAAAPLHGFLGTATATWRDGLAALDHTVLEAIDAEGSIDTTELIRDAAVSLAVGDAAYAQFLGAVPALDEDFDPPAFPEVAFVTGVPTDIQLLIDRLVVAPDLDERRDVAVTANTRPEPTGTVGSALVMPFSDLLDVTAVVTNQGNVAADEVMVELTLEGETVDPFTEQRIIPSLAPGGAETIEVLGIPLEPETLYTLTITASIRNDDSTDDNVWEVVFATNAA
ncbi:MAG: CARDB domain-containing protein [Acidimicrobiia bacterium]